MKGVYCQGLFSLYKILSANAETSIYDEIMRR
jgi:hypothetical protein